MSQTPEEMNSFEAVTRAGALPKPYRWDRPLPEVGAQVIVERPGGGEEVAVVTGHQPRQAADAPQALALATPDRLELLERQVVALKKLSRELLSAQEESLRWSAISRGVIHMGRWSHLFYSLLT